MTMDGEARKGGWMVQSECRHFRGPREDDKGFRTRMDGLCLLRGHAIMSSVCEICRNFDPAEIEYWRPLP